METAGADHRSGLRLVEGKRLNRHVTVIPRIRRRLRQPALEILRAPDHKFGFHMLLARLFGLYPRTTRIPTAAQHGADAKPEPIRLLHRVLEQGAPFRTHVVGPFPRHPLAADAVHGHSAHPLGLQGLQIRGDAFLIQLVAEPEPPGPHPRRIRRRDELLFKWHGSRRANATQAKGKNHRYG